MKLPSVQHMITESVTSFRRFPFTILSAIVAVSSAIYLTELDFDAESGIATRLLMVSALGISLFTVIVITGEKRSVDVQRLLGLQAAGVLVLALYFFWLPADIADTYQKPVIRYILFFLGMHLLVAVLPYWGSDDMNGFWQYNKSLFLRFLTAVLYSGVLYVGLSVALLSIDQLFGVEIKGERYAELWFILAGLFNTWFFLSGVPEDLDALEEVHDYPKGLKVFTQYVLIPLVAVYVLILYGYTVKIVLEWEWPEGWVANLVLGFSIVGILALLLLHPIRNRVEYGWIKSISRNYYIALLPLVVLLLLAIWVRLSEYSFTENRYFVLVAGFWLGAISLYFIFSSAKNIKLIPASLAVIVFLSSFGPWSAFSVSEHSQVNRLEGYLADNGILTDGSIQPVSAEIPLEDAREISAITRYLAEFHGLAGLEPWFDREPEIWNEIADSAYANADLQAQALVEALGVTYLNRWESTPSIYRSFTASERHSLPIDEYDWLVTDLNLNNGRDSDSLYFDTDTLLISFVRDSAEISLFSSRNEQRPAFSIDLDPMIRRLHAGYSTSESYRIPPEEMVLTAENEGIRLKLLFRNIQARRDEDRWRIESLRLSMLLKYGE